MDDELDSLTKPVLLPRETFFDDMYTCASITKSVIACRLTAAQKCKVEDEFTHEGHAYVILAISIERELTSKR